MVFHVAGIAICDGLTCCQQLMSFEASWEGKNGSKESRRDRALRSMEVDEVLTVLRCRYGQLHSFLNRVPRHGRE